VSKNSRITVGGEAISKIRQIKADILFLGVNAMDAVNGVTDNDWEVVQVKKAMIESARKVICLTIAEKINSYMPFHVCPAEDLDMLITELPPEDPLLEPYLRKGIQIL
jgi:DeoR/GlpR family transcriptional regulator of sugar metabolism